MSPSERGEESGCIVAVLDGKRCELERGDPTLCSLFEDREIRSVEQLALGLVAPFRLGFGRELESVLSARVPGAASTTRKP